MSEPLFNIVFYGITQPGKDRNTVMQNMAALFKTEAAKIAPYFSGERKVIKSNVDEINAEKYRTALEKAGLVIKIEAADSPTPSAAASVTIETGSLTMAPPGANVVENPAAVTPQPIGDISDISMAEVGANVIENPVAVTPQPIGDISDISMAEVGANVIENPVEVTPQPIGDISDITLAETGADLIENPKKKEKAPEPDISKLSLK